MKKILFLFICIIGLVSCGYTPMNFNKTLVITEIEQVSIEYCDYYGDGGGVYQMTNSVTSTKFKFRDKTGKYQIGDTIITCKK